MLYAELLDGQEYIDYLKRSIYLFLSLISMKIDSVDGKRINIVDMLTVDCPCEKSGCENKDEIIKKIIDFLD